MSGAKSQEMKLSKVLEIRVSSLAAILIFLALNYGHTQNLPVQSTTTGPQPLTLGIIADCQYADKPVWGVRNYSLSDQKLKQCVGNFNTMQLDHVFHLGDFIDEDIKSFDRVLPIVKQLNAPLTLVLGNHDFSVSEDFKEKVPGIMGLKERYFSLSIKRWKFIILDGNDVSLFAWPMGSKREIEAREIHQRKYIDQATYNGALSNAQMAWLKVQLEQAESNAENVILLCHFPLFPADEHVLWNSTEVLELISGYGCVKAWLNGHNHAGDYAEYQGIHFITFKGMVDTEENSYATVQLQGDQLRVTGFGREDNLTLTLKGDY